MFNADATTYEQLAGQMLQLGGGAPADPGGAAAGRGARTLSADLFPHLKIINKDKSHGANMITSTLGNVYHRLAHEVIVSSASMAQLLQHSDVLRARRKTRQRVADEPCLVLKDDHTQCSKSAG